MKMKLNLFLLGLLLSALSALAQGSIPAGTIIPIRLNSTLSSKTAKKDQRISARVMQDVPLPNGHKIPEGSKITGHVIEVRKAGPGGGSAISFTFDGVLVSKQRLALSTVFGRSRRRSLWTTRICRILAWARVTLGVTARPTRLAATLFIGAAARSWAPQGP